MVMVLKRYIQSERAGLWDNHLSEIDNMLPYLVAAGHYKYVSCVSHYLTAMKRVPANTPDRPSFQGGKVQGGKTLEGSMVYGQICQTYNCEAKTNLFHGISQNIFEHFQ